jgi:hypothetical protein
MMCEWRNIRACMDRSVYRSNVTQSGCYVHISQYVSQYICMLIIMLSGALADVGM